MMSKARQKGKRSKEATARREDETSFMEGSADPSLKTGHSRSPGATGGEGSIQTSEVSGPGEEDQTKKKRGTFKRLRKGFSRVSSHSSKSSLKHAVQSPTSPTSLGGDSLRQSEEMEEVSENESAPLREPSAVSCDSQASGGPVSPTTELEKRENQHKLEIEFIRKQYAARVSETRKLREELVQKEKQSQILVQSMEKQLQIQLMQEKERHAQEKKQMIDNYEARLQEAAKQHETEKNRLLLQNIPEKLKRYYRKAKPTGKELGHGTYGIVLEFESAGETFAGKVFKNVMPQSSSQIEERFHAELILMATFQHPNLVQLIGVCFLPDKSNFPILLMEKMMTDLHTYLMDPQNKTFLFIRKALILHDVASGLKYLHEGRPALVHRDLTSKNVLLTAELTAKIGDFGTGKIMDLDPEATPDTHTTKPGALGYMPPEAVTEHAKYDTKVDIFAFGHLTLFAFLQTRIPLQPATYLDEWGSLHPRSEVKRRQNSIDKASELLGENCPLVVLLKRCLHNSPGQRPCASEILVKIQEVISDMQEKAQEDLQNPHCESTVKDKITLTDEVSLDKLSLMKLPNGERVKIIETVAKDWRKVGCQLNFDQAGNQLDIIEKQKLKDPLACCEAMFQHWLNGNGVKPTTWKTLIDILKDCEHVILAQQVERALTH